MANAPDLKGSSFTLSVLHLSDNLIKPTLDYLEKKIAKSPSFFASAPVVINIAKVEGDIDFSALKRGILSIGMIPVGVTGSKDKRTENRASEAGFAIMLSSKSHIQAPSEIVPTKIIHTPIRSGQQVYARDCDLVILNHVNAGAEVIADGSIHIHGTLRGRAIAGASGQTDAKIICQDLQAELLSIAGNYWLSDQIEPEYWQKKIMLTMQDNCLHFKALNI